VSSCKRQVKLLISSRFAILSWKAHSLSARNLTLEILCKLCAHAENMNFLLATPPVERLRRLFQNLAKLLADTDQVGLNSISWLKVKLADYSILYIMRGFVC